MKNICSVLCLSFLFLLLFVTPVMSSDDWVEYDRDKDGSVILYNNRNITKSGGKNIVQVWTKWIISEKDREKTLKVRRNDGLSTEGYSKLSYGIVLEQIDCKNKKFQTLSITEYDTDGKDLSSVSLDKRKWDYIVPDSNVDILRKKVCK